MRTDDFQPANGGGPRVVVVGPCASGKTTLVAKLTALGVDARVSGQEHSAVRNLWRRLEPDVVIALDVDLDTLRARRSPTWPAGLYAVQHGRLQEAFDVADVVIDTGTASEDEVLDAALAIIERHAINSG
ncbi:MAG: hypothetical protein H0V37_06180 [Chloroflexia bacterium]|nr:hypothetical protein [Chloroflexia bacterium]